MDKNRLIDEITAVVMERLANDGRPPKVVAFGDVPAGVIGAGCDVRKGNGPHDVGDAEYIVLTAKSFRTFHHIPEPEPDPEKQAAEYYSQTKSEADTSNALTGRVIDLRGNRLVHEQDLRSQNLREGDVVQADSGAIITAAAYDYVNSVNATLEVC